MKGVGTSWLMDRSRLPHRRHTLAGGPLYFSSTGCADT
jgi:hypothetical protein